jgi:hypothetical protein
VNIITGVNIVTGLAPELIPMFTLFAMDNFVRDYLLKLKKQN